MAELYAGKEREDELVDFGMVGRKGRKEGRANAPDHAVRSFPYNVHPVDSIPLVLVNFRCKRRWTALLPLASRVAPVFARPERERDRSGTYTL
jgi:hypothetical protein